MAQIIECSDHGDASVITYLYPNGYGDVFINGSIIARVRPCMTADYELTDTDVFTPHALGSANTRTSLVSVVLSLYRDHKAHRFSAALPTAA